MSRFKESEIKREILINNMIFSLWIFHIIEIAVFSVLFGKRVQRIEAISKTRVKYDLDLFQFKVNTLKNLIPQYLQT